jgi:glycosyltransferase involved in cell wall biosynthesis
VKILMVHNRYQAAGGEDASTDAQVALLRDSGHGVVRVEDTNERIAELGNARTAARSIWSPEAKRRIVGILSDGGFDIMHVQNLFPLFSPSIYYAAAECGVPVVQSLRNFRALCPEGMLCRDGRVCTDCLGKPVAWPGVRHGCYRDSVPGTAVVATMATAHRVIGTWRKRVARYVTPSAHTRDLYVAGGWDPDTIDVIPNHVYPDPGPGRGDGGYAIYAGRLAPPKGLDTLIAAWHHGQFDIPLKIAGEGPLKHLVEQAAAANPNIEFLGEVTPEETSALVGRAAFSIVPTVGIETFGRVAAESLAAGTPVVAADHGGLSEIVVDGKTGLLFPPGDVSALTDAIDTLVADPERLAAMRAVARQDFLDRYAGSQVLAKWVDLYREVIARR